MSEEKRYARRFGIAYGIWLAIALALCALAGETETAALLQVAVFTFPGYMMALLIPGMEGVFHSSSWAEGFPYLWTICTSNAILCVMMGAAFGALWPHTRNPAVRSTFLRRLRALFDVHAQWGSGAGIGKEPPYWFGLGASLASFHVLFIPTFLYTSLLMIDSHRPMTFLLKLACITGVIASFAGGVLYGQYLRIHGLQNKIGTLSFRVLLIGLPYTLLPLVWRLTEGVGVEASPYLWFIPLFFLAGGLGCLLVRVSRRGAENAE